MRRDFEKFFPTLDLNRSRQVCRWDRAETDAASVDRVIRECHLEEFVDARLQALQRLKSEQVHLRAYLSRVNATRSLDIPERSELTLVDKIELLSELKRQAEENLDRIKIYD